MRLFELPEIKVAALFTGLPLLLEDPDKRLVERARFRVSSRARTGALTASLAACFFVAQTAIAEPLYLSVGEARLYPEITLSYLGNDNVFASRQNQQEAAGLLVEPRITYLASRGDNGLSLTYGGRYLNSEESRVSFADHRLQLQGKGVFSKRSRARATLAFDVTHYPPGGRLSREINEQLSEPYAYNQLLFNSRYTYGASRARGNIAVGLRARSVEHTNEPNPNNPTRTDGLDFTKITPFAVFSLRLSGDTRAFLDLRFGTADYDAFSSANTAELDHTDLRAYVGTSWELTGRTGGSIGVGIIQIDYDANSLDDDELLGIDIDAFYDLTSYSRLQIGVSREQDSVTDNTVLGREDVIDLLWEHEWSSRLKSDVGLALETSFGICSVGTTRTERKFTQSEVKAGISLQVRRWLKIGLGVEITDEEADDCADPAATGTFEQNQVLASVNVTL